jgi:hypothetical protein
MLTLNREITKPVLGQADIDMVYDALVAWCSERQCQIDSDQARDAARELVSWFECGIRDRRKLGQIIRCI